MNPMNVAGMNAMPGGPVGGVPMMPAGSGAPRNEPVASQEQLYQQLNTCIYDYFLKRGHFEIARALYQDDSVKLTTHQHVKTSPGQSNGIDNDTVMMDGKDGEKLKIPDDLPAAGVPMDSQQSFLFDWFSVFWDIFLAHRKKSNNSTVNQFIAQNMMRMREQSQFTNMNRQPQMMQAQVNQLANMRRNGAMNNLQKTVLQNNSQITPQQMAALQKNQMMQMREQSEMEMNGHRPQSPSSAENAPSPSKRPRLEGAHMNGQPMAPNGRGQGQGMPGQPNPQAMLMQGINPRGMNPAQFQAFQNASNPAQQKSIQVYAQNLALHHSRSAMNNQGMPNGLINPAVMPNQNDLMQPMPDGQGMLPMGGEFYGANGQMVRPGMQTPGGQSGNHALQDYQMQLMLLEQQNKRRLMMARQEQDSIARADGQPPLPGQPGLPPGTSPQGSRTGTSPNPSEQMKRGTPKISQSGLPGSPSAGDVMQGRGSPGSMNFNAGQIPPDMSNAFFMKPDGMVGPNMRPPSSNPGFNPQMVQAVQQAGAGNRMPGGWQPQQGPQGQPMMPQQSPATQPASTPQERNQMPPPSAPPVGGANKPTSPQPRAAPPTPQQANKPAPKGKKDTKDTRKRPSKKAAAAAANANTAATPSSEAEPPPTPTPSTPITPQHPNSFSKAGANATTSTQQQQPTSAPAPPSMIPQPDPTQQSFNDLGIPDPSAFNLDFSALENPDILENFDFDTFLNTDADTAGFGFDPSITYPTDGVEAGTGDGL